MSKYIVEPKGKFDTVVFKTTGGRIIKCKVRKPKALAVFPTSRGTVSFEGRKTEDECRKEGAKQELEKLMKFLCMTNTWIEEKDKRAYANFDALEIYDYVKKRQRELNE